MVASPLQRSIRLPPGSGRKKAQLSCQLCRQRKLKCDRERPCGSCTHRGLKQSCYYPDSKPANSLRKPPLPNSSIKQRLQDLESLVTKLVEGTPEPGHWSMNPESSTASISPERACSPDVLAADPIQSSPERGSMKLSGAGNSYVNASHWAAVLDRISELKNHFDGEAEPLQASNVHQNPLLLDAPSPQLLYASLQHISREDILTFIPARPVVDRLVSRCFRAFDMYPAVLHSTQFLNEYEKFWANPTETPIIWLGLLFGVMCLAVQLQTPMLDADALSYATLDPVPTAQMLREKTVQCLLMGQYTKGGPHTLETMILYLANEHFVSKDTNFGIWFILGAIVQLSTHMGYHKDPEHFSHISAFHGEMRRRVWATVVELDLGLSAQMGLPRLLKPCNADVREPRNLFDSDFDMSTVNLPDSRPETTLTPILHRIAKSRITNVLGLITDLAADSRHHTYAETADLDTQLNAARASVPKCLKWKSILHCITEPAHIIMQKIFLEQLFWKSKIILHRKYFVSEQSPYSHQACISAALRLLDIQSILAKETQPGGQLHQERWKVTSAVNHDFLLATSILCFHLQRRKSIAGDDVETASLDGIRQSLRGSQTIWLRSSASSSEARKAACAISVVLSECDSSSSVCEQAQDNHVAPEVNMLSAPTDGDFAFDLSDYLSADVSSCSFFDYSFLPDVAGLENDTVESNP